MKTLDNRTTRRGFFVSGGALLGASVVAAAGAAEPRPSQQGDAEAIRALQASFAAGMEHQQYDILSNLFSESAELELSGPSVRGRDAIETFFAQHYGCQQGSQLHCAYRSKLAGADRIVVGDSGVEATARFDVDVSVATPLRGDTTVEQMARLQGQMAERHWESGRIEARYVRGADGWKIATLRYRAG